MNTITHFRQFLLILFIFIGAVIMSQSRDLLYPVKENQPEDQTLILWNKLGSEYEVTHSEIGPNGSILGTAYAFEPAKFGNGYVRKEVGVNYVSFPGSIFDTLTERGSIELWVNPKVSGPVPYQYGDFALIGTIYGHFGTPDNDNIRIIWSDGSDPGELGFVGWIKFDGDYIRTSYEPVQFVATPYVPFHVSISWDILGIDGSLDTVRVYRDGQVVSKTTATWNPAGTERHDIILGYIPDDGGYDKHIVDNIKIWNYAKTDFSDRFNESNTFNATKVASSSQAHHNERVDFTITLKNPKEENITNVQVTDPLPNGLDYISDSLIASSGTPQFNNGIVSWNGGVLANNQVTIQFGTTINSGVPIGSTLTNTAEINGDGLSFSRSASVLVDFYQVFLPYIYRPCNPLYSDNFSNPASGWYVGDDGNVRYEYVNSEYRILIRPSEWGAGTAPGFQASDYSVAVDLHNLNNIWGSYGLAFGIDSNWDTFYSLEIYPDGWFGLYRWDLNGFVVLAEAYSTAIKQGSTSNHIKVERNGASINAYANGQLLVSMTDSTYTGTKYLGLVAFTYNQTNLDIRYDNFTVYPISCLGVNSPSIIQTERSRVIIAHGFDFDIIEKRHAKIQQ